MWEIITKRFNDRFGHFDGAESGSAKKGGWRLMQANRESLLTLSLLVPTLGERKNSLC